MEEESRIFISRLFWARYIKIVTAGKKESFKELFSSYWAKKIREHWAQ